MSKIFSHSLMSLLLSFILFFLCSCNSFFDGKKNDSKILEVNLQGQKYDNLNLEITRYTENMQSNRLHYVEGKRIDDHRWIFEIPDSINQISRYFKLKYKPFDFTSNTDFEVTFLSVIEGDSLLSNMFVYDINMNPIEASYLYKDSDVLPSSIVGDTLFVDDVTIISDVFYVNLDNYKSTELEAIMKGGSFGIYSNKQDEDEYQRDLSNTIKLAEKYSYSQYLLAKVAYFKAAYNGGEDMRRVFEKFTNTQSEDAKFYNDIIIDYINFNPYDFVFENVKLQNSMTGIEEFVIEESDEPSLIVFSASWCGPCHERIPLLKEVFSEKGDEVNIIYISIDEPSTAENWEGLLIAKDIPWRSLSLLNDEHGVMRKYKLPGVPYVMFIHPGGKGEIINLDVEQDKLKLYDMLD